MTRHCICQVAYSTSISLMFFSRKVSCISFYKQHATWFSLRCNLTCSALKICFLINCSKTVNLVSIWLRFFKNFLLVFYAPTSVDKLRTEGHRKLKIGRKEAQDTDDPWPHLEIERSKVKVTRLLNAVTKSFPFIPPKTIFHCAD